MQRSLSLQIAGPGIVFYSPWAVAHIERGADFLAASYSEASDVAAQVNAGALVGVCTGSPGTFALTMYSGACDESAVGAADFKVRLCMEVRDEILCVRDLYDLLAWNPECPQSQVLALENGFYRITAYTSLPPGGILGDDQAVFVHFEAMSAPFFVAHSGVPQLC